MTDDDLELVYLTLEDALELYAAITDSTTEHATAVLRARSTLEGALARPAAYAHYEDSDISLQAAVLAHGRRDGRAARVLSGVLAAGVRGQRVGRLSMTWSAEFSLSSLSAS